MNFGEICRLSLRYLHQETDNHEFGIPGADNANLLNMVNDAYREYCRITEICRKVKQIVTASGTAGYNLASYFSDSYYDDYEVLKCNFPGEEIALEFVDYDRYQYMAKDNAGLIWGWSIWEDPAGHTTGVTKTIYFIDTPGVETIEVQARVLPIAMVNSTDKPIVGGEHQGLIAKAAAKMWTASKRGLFYDMAGDYEIIGSANAKKANEANVDPRIRHSLDKNRGVRAAVDYDF